MRLLVCGGRRYNDGLRFLRVINAIHARMPITSIIEGGAKGADALARSWAWSQNITPETYNAEWEKIDGESVVRYRDDGSVYDATAGITRNTRMLTEGAPEMVLAFAGGDGTENMMDQAINAGVPTLWVPDSSSLLNGEPVDKPVWMLKPTPGRAKVLRAGAPTPVGRYDAEF